MLCSLSQAREFLKRIDSPVSSLDYWLAMTRHVYVAGWLVNGLSELCCAKWRIFIGAIWCITIGWLVGQPWANMWPSRRLPRGSPGATKIMGQVWEEATGVEPSTNNNWAKPTTNVPFNLVLHHKELCAYLKFINVAFEGRAKLWGVSLSHTTSTWPPTERSKGGRPMRVGHWP